MLYFIYYKYIIYTIFYYAHTDTHTHTEHSYVHTQWNISQPLKKPKQGNSAICSNIDGLWEHFPK